MWKKGPLELPDDPYIQTTTPIMSDEYPFWLTQYGITNHRFYPVQHEITTNTAVTRIQYVISGKEIINTKDVSVIANAGDTYILHEGDTHNYHSDTSDPSHIMWIHVKGKLANEVMKIYKMDDIILLKNIDTSQWILKFHEICKATNDPYVIQEESASFFVKFIHHIYREYEQNKQNIDYLDDIKSYIDLHIHDNIDIETLAQISKVSVDHTIRTFKTKFGLTPHQYMLKSKIILAKTMLRSTQKSIEEISQTLGFNDVGYFSNFFLKKTGSRPSEYRKKKSWNTYHNDN